MRLYLIRHPRPTVAAGVCYGRTDLEVCLDEHQKTLDALMHALPADAPLYSSPLRRCSEFASHLSAALGMCEVIHDPRLMEMHFGAWEMQAWDAIPRAEIDAWAADMHSYRPGGGECVSDMVERVRAFLDELQQQKHESAIVVCHMGTIRILSACLQHASSMEVAKAIARTRQSVEYGELVVLDC